MHCLIVETTLQNPTSPGSGSSTDISLIAPHSFSVATGKFPSLVADLTLTRLITGFGYYNGCDGAGADCSGPNCNTAFHQPDDTYVQVACQSNNVRSFPSFFPQFTMRCR